MGYPLPVDTAHVRLRTRQYRILHWDLGEGIERSTLKVGAIFCLPWWLACHLIGVPIPQLVAVWIVPPIVLTYRSMTRDASGRLRLRGWVDRAAGLLPDRRAPIVNADTGGTTGPAPAIETDMAYLVVDLDTVLQTMDASGIYDDVLPDFRDKEAPRAREAA